MNQELRDKMKDAARKMAANKKAPKQPETQFQKGAEWMYDLLIGGDTVDAHREKLRRDVISRKGRDPEDWEESLIEELAGMLAEVDGMRAQIREEGRLILKHDKNLMPYKESNPLYVHVKAQQQTISVWRDKLGLSDTVNPERIRQSAKKNGDRENDPINEYFEGING